MAMGKVTAEQIRPGWRFYGGIILFVLGLLSPLFVPLVTATALPSVLGSGSRKRS